jgi:hypothetical protein
MRASVQKWVLLHTICLSAAGAWGIGGQVACSSAPAGEVSSDQDAASTSTGSTTSVGLELTLPDGEQITSVNWYVSGPDGSSTIVQSGNQPVGDSGTLSFSVQMPRTTAPGSYVILLSGLSRDGLAVCAGTETFSVLDGGMAPVQAVLQCTTSTPDAASALVTASAYNCAAVSAVWASPAEAQGGSPIAVSAAAVAPDASAVSYQWSAPSGSFDTPGSATANFTCPAAGGVIPLTVTVSDGIVPDSSTCPAASTTVQVTCDGPDL